MAVLDIRLIVWLQVMYFWVNGLQLPLPFRFDGVPVEKEVNIVVRDDGTRFRRSSDGITIPARKLEVSFPIENNHVTLHLSRNDDVLREVPVYTTNEDGVIVKENLDDDHEAFYYQDIANGATVFVQTSQSSYCLFGSFFVDSEEFFLEPTQRECTDSLVNSTFRVWRADFSQFQYSDVRDEKFLQDKIVPGKHRKRSKRSVSEMKIETLFILDYSIYSYWNSTVTVSNETDRARTTRSVIRQFYAFVINGMDVRYKNIPPDYDFTLSVVFAGIYIADTESKSPFTEDHKVVSMATTHVDADDVLNHTTQWLQQTTGLPGFDHAMMFSRFDFTSNSSSAVSGLAWLGTMCKQDSVSIVEDHFNFIIMTVAAHELGHSLGAEHDGTNNDCNSTSYYVMAPYVGVEQGQLNPWSFSNCSIRYFADLVAELDEATNCLRTLTSDHDPTALVPEINTLPGSVYDVNEHCRHIVGQDSQFCRAPYEGNFTDICTILYCFDKDGLNCNAYLGGDGLPCGNKKWCLSGVCTYSDSAPAGNEGCLFGDDPTFEWLDSNTCNGSGNRQPISSVDCYNETVRKRCCESCSSFYTGITGCEYGDKNVHCESKYCDSDAATCCQTCLNSTSNTTENTTETTTTTKASSSISSSLEPLTTTVSAVTTDSTVGQPTTSLPPETTSVVSTQSSSVITTTEFESTLLTETTTSNELMETSSLTTTKIPTTSTMFETTSSEPVVTITSTTKSTTSTVISSTSVTSDMLLSTTESQPVTSTISTTQTSTSSSSSSSSSSSTYHSTTSSTTEEKSSTSTTPTSTQSTSLTTTPTSTQSTSLTTQTTKLTSTLPTTTTLPTTSSSVTTSIQTTSSPATQRRMNFEVSLNVNEIRNLSNPGEYSQVVEDSQNALSDLYRRQMGDSFRRVKVNSVRTGSLIVDHDVFVQNSPSALLDVVNVMKNISDGKTNITYNGNDVNALSVSFTDSSNKKVLIDGNTDPNAVIDASFVCSSDDSCDRKTAVTDDEKGLSKEAIIIISCVAACTALMVIVAVVILVCICRHKPKTKTPTPNREYQHFLFNQRTTDILNKANMKQNVSERESTSSQHPENSIGGHYARVSRVPHRAPDNNGYDGRIEGGKITEPDVLPTNRNWGQPYRPPDENNSESYSSRRVEGGDRRPEGYASSNGTDVGRLSSSQGSSYRYESNGRDMEQSSSQASRYNGNERSAAKQLMEATYLRNYESRNDQYSARQQDMNDPVYQSTENMGHRRHQKDPGYSSKFTVFSDRQPDYHGSRYNNKRPNSFREARRPDANIKHSQNRSGADMPPAQYGRRWYPGYEQYLSEKDLWHMREGPKYGAARGYYNNAYK